MNNPDTASGWDIVPSDIGEYAKIRDLLIDWERSIKLSLSDQKNPTERALKTAEETGKLAQAVLSVFGAHTCGYKNKTKDHILEEAIDTIQCAISVIIKAYEEEGFPEERFRELYTEKLNKWYIKQKA